MLRRLPASWVALVAALVFAAPAAAATDSSGNAGAVRFVKRMTPAFNQYVEHPTADQSAWLSRKLWRTEVFTPYFDDKLAAYGNGWVYSDLYAIYTGSDLATQHPDWILRDGAGRKLYIPWGCGGGTCPQYAADITNPAYRAWWISTLKTSLAKGYRGAWIDDVNLELRVSDANGADAAPVSSALGRTMGSADWRRAMADFTTQIRAEVPADKELLHNSIWYAGQDNGRDADPDVKREIASADYINIERGFGDGGLTGGKGEWSLRALQGVIDRVHQQGKGVIVDGFDQTPAGMEYALANYLLINTGRDGIGEIDMTPDNWWGGWDTTLGNALGERYDWQGLMRRDFNGGLVLVNEPGAAPRTVTLPRPMTTVDGRTVTTVTVSGSGGVVLTGQGERGATDAAAPATRAAGANCSRVRVRYSTVRWNARAGKLAPATGSAVVCLDARLVPGTKAHRAAVRKARAQARRSSVREARRARRQAVRAQAARASAAKAAAQA